MFQLIKGSSSTIIAPQIKRNVLNNKNNSFNSKTFNQNKSYSLQSSFNSPHLLKNQVPKQKYSSNTGSHIMENAKDKLNDAMSEMNEVAHKTDLKKIWMKPEAYPILLTIALALGVCGYHVYKLGTDPLCVYTKNDLNDWDKVKQGTSRKYLQFKKEIQKKADQLTSN